MDFFINDSAPCSNCILDSPPNDILLIPPPPLPPFFQDYSKEQDTCNFCNLLNNQDPLHKEPSTDYDQRLIALVIAFILLTATLFIYFISRKTNFLSTSSKNNSNDNICTHLPINESLTSNGGVHMADQCYLQTTRDKNLISPIISDHVSHKKTSIPSKYWSQPGSIISRTTQRIPNEYEVPSSKTNSTATSSAIYAPYNMHTYAEVREVFEGYYPHQQQQPPQMQMYITSHSRGVNPGLLTNEQEPHHVI